MSLLIGVSGGSGSGKTTLARLLHQSLGPNLSVMVLQDSYYIDRSHEFKGDGTINFDHPEALDWDLMVEQMRLLQKGRPVDVPVYDFTTHRRQQPPVRVEPKKVILVDGILILHPKSLRELFDFRIFVDCPEPLRFERRLKRDVEERGRTPEGVRRQYESTVLPMHNAFVEPTKVFADQVVSGVQDLKSAVSSILKKVGV